MPTKKKSLRVTPAELEELARKAQALEAEQDTLNNLEIYRSPKIQAHLTISDELIGTQEEIQLACEELGHSQAPGVDPKEYSRQQKEKARALAIEKTNSEVSRSTLFRKRRASDGESFVFSESAATINERNQKFLRALRNAPDIAKYFATEYALDVPEFEIRENTEFRHLKKLLEQRFSPQQLRERRIAWKRAREYLLRRNKKHFDLSKKEDFLFKQAVYKIQRHYSSQRIDYFTVLRRIIVEFSLQTVFGKGDIGFRHLKFKEYRSLDKHTEAPLLDVMSVMVLRELSESGMLDEERTPLNLKSHEALRREALEEAKELSGLNEIPGEVSGSLSDARVPEEVRALPENPFDIKQVLDTKEQEEPVEGFTI